MSSCRLSRFVLTIVNFNSLIVSGWILTVNFWRHFQLFISNSLRFISPRLSLSYLQTVVIRAVMCMRSLRVISRYKLPVMMMMMMVFLLTYLSISRKRRSHFVHGQGLGRNSGADSIGYGEHVPPTFTNGWARGHRE